MYSYNGTIGRVRRVKLIDIMSQVNYVPNIVDDMSQKQDAKYITVKICNGLEMFYKECQH